MHKISKSTKRNLHIRCDTLSGGYVIYQPREGQRYTTDDMLAGWMAVRTLRRMSSIPDMFIDLGSGLCSVPMIVMWSFPGLAGIGVEIQNQRSRLARRSLATNALDSRFLLINGDLRRLHLKRSFEFITSSPPYYQPEEGPVSPHTDRARVRFELKGSIHDYFDAASRLCVPQGHFITVYPYQYTERVINAAETTGFSCEREIHVVPRAGKPSLISLFSFVKGKTAEAKQEETLTIRNRDLGFTAQYRNVRRQIGFPAPR